MALVLGTSCGFVTSSPSADPGGTALEDVDTTAQTLKATAPVGATKVTEIGWWCDNATEEANFEVGIYGDNGSGTAPDAVIELNQTNAKGTGAGWKKVTGLNIAITAGTIYWIAMQLDDTATGTDTDKTNDAGEFNSHKNAQTTLTSPWGSSDGSAARLIGVYAVYGVEAGGQDGPYVY